MPLQKSPQGSLMNRRMSAQIDRRTSELFVFRDIHGSKYLNQQTQFDFRENLFTQDKFQETIASDEVELDASY
jgi:hypothetical protein